MEKLASDVLSPSGSPKVVNRPVYSSISRANILLVEDEAILALDIADDVEAWGYKVTGVVTGLEGAISCAQRRRPDLALVDISLSEGRNGTEVAKILKEKFGTSIVFLTAYSDSKTRAEIVSTHPAGFLFKPYSSLALKSLLNSLFPE